MRTLSSKTLLAALNPSPVFEAIAIFAEQLALNATPRCSYRVSGMDAGQSITSSALRGNPQRQGCA